VLDDILEVGRVVACLATNPRAHWKQVLTPVQTEQKEEQGEQTVPLRKDPSKQLRQALGLLGLHRMQLPLQATQVAKFWSMSIECPKGQMAQLPLLLQARLGSQFWRLLVLKV
jgi:hypothetical protein